MPEWRTTRKPPDAHEAMVLGARGLEKRFEGFTLGPVDLDIHVGRIYGLLGMNGAGKTTLLSCLAQQSRPTAGSLSVGSRTAAWGDCSHREVVALVREVPVLYEPLSAAQHIRLASRLFMRWNGALAEHWLDLLRIDAHKRVRHFSKGMRVKLALILALAHEPRFLLLDEPLNGVDIDSRLELQALLQEIAAQERAGILIASHVLQDVDDLATDVIVMRDGGIAYTSGRDALGALAAWTLPADVPVRLPPTHEPLRTWVDRQGRRLLTRGPTPIAGQSADGSADVRQACLEDIYLAFTRGTDGKRMASGEGAAD